MITYFYWIIVLALMLATIYGLGYKLDEWKYAGLTALGILIVAYVAYNFHFQQVFVKRYGGVMSITVPKGQRHIVATWKDDNLWVENYEPATNTCYFTEYSKGDLLQGKVTLKNCNPLFRQQ